MSLLQVQNLHTHFKTDAGVARAVDGITFDIKKGECVALVGESGCGKSVTSFTIMRLLPMPPAMIPEGQVLFKGRDLAKLSESEMCKIRGREIGMIFQEPQSALNPVFTVGEQISEAFLTHNPDAQRREAWEKTVEAMRAVGIPDPQRRASDYPHQLSGGMKQRICIAMALICSPELLIADEPTTALDVTIQAQILDLMRKLRETLGMALILITHDLGVIAETADEVLVMYAGKVVEQAPVAELFANPKHPYTRGLLSSIPKFSTDPMKREKKKRLETIPGIVPALTELPKGCRFQTRCPHVMDECRVKEPQLRTVGPEHGIACFKDLGGGLS